MSLTSAFKRLSSGGGTGKHPLPGTNLELSSARLLLRIGQPRDWQAWRDLRSGSRAFLEPWEPSWPPEALTFEHYGHTLRREWREWKDGHAYTFFIFLKTSVQDPFDRFGQKDAPPAATASDENLRLVGSITLSNIERGAAQKGRLGYWVGKPFAKRGIMTEAAKLIMNFGFSTLALHRIEANCMPSNEPSIKLLAKLGFEKEGAAKRFLKIRGVWEDHLLWGKSKEEG